MKKHGNSNSHSVRLRYAYAHNCFALPFIYIIIRRGGEQLRSYERNEEFLGNHGNPSNHSSEIDEDSDIDDVHSLFDVSCLPSMRSLMTECELTLYRSLLYRRRSAMHPLLVS